MKTLIHLNIEFYGLLIHPIYVHSIRNNGESNKSNTKTLVH